MTDGTVDWYFTNGHLWDATSNGFKPGEMVVRDGSIEEMVFKKKLSHGSFAGAERIDLEGGYLCPGFIDSHMHLFQWSITRKGLDLSWCRSEADIEDAIGSVLDGGSSDQIFETNGIVFGRDFDDSKFRDGPLNDGRFLERKFPDIPILLRRICGHKALVNSEGLGMIDTDNEASNGVILEEGAMEAPWKLPLKNEILSTFLSEAIDHLHSHGVQGGVDILPSSQFEKMTSVLSNIDKEFLLTASIIRDGEVPTGKRLQPATWDEPYETPLPDENEIPIVYEKFFLDGSIGSRTASFSQDYSDAERSGLIMDDKTLKEKVRRSSDDGLVPMVHCIGDKAISQAVRVLEDFDILYRLEHAEAINDEHIDGMRNGKGALCLQPNFQKNWGGIGGLYEQCLNSRCQYLNPFRTIADSGIPWCFGTDMMPPVPLYAVQGATKHPNRDQRLKREEALNGFTTHSRKLSFISGSTEKHMSVGSQANIIIINKEFYGINTTFLKGKIVYLHHK